ncbi:MAG: hypothetical protein K2J47_06940 [Ruminococcus sp.]|nr:hypothetical protein [Ruminococcus sp.]
MKKFISAVLSAFLAASSMGVLCASAAEVYGEGYDVVVFGDSIAEGYDLDKNNYNYGQIVADYLSGTVSNYAKAGDKTADTLGKISSASDLADAEIVIISSGANDMISYSTNYILKLCAQIGALAGGATTDDIPENPTFRQMINMIDTDELKSFASSSIQNQMALNSSISALGKHLACVEGENGYEKYDRIIETQVIPNIEQMIDDIKAVNPNARIIIQNLYNPMQLEQSYLDETIPLSYKSLFKLLTPVFKSVIDSYNKQISAIEGVEIADIYADFNADNGNVCYFTDFQDASIKEFKIHPNQAGHLAIAVNIINVIGEKSEDGGLLNLTYEKLRKKDSYPAIALEEYNNVAGTYVLGDINGDLIIDSGDASLSLVEYAARSTNRPSELSEAEQKAADANSDTLVDSSDATVMLSYYSYASTGNTGSLKYFMMMD